jgi:LysM repeat protein
MTCHKVVLNSDDFGYRDYTVAAGETVFSIAKKYNLSEHMILEANKLKSYTGLTTGQKLKLPTIYAKKTELLIDVATMLPVKTLVYDDQGLYERYEYYNLKLNPTLSANAFSTDNPAYGF